MSKPTVFVRTGITGHAYKRVSVDPKTLAKGMRLFLESSKPGSGTLRLIRDAYSISDTISYYLREELDLLFETPGKVPEKLRRDIKREFLRLTRT